MSKIRTVSRVLGIKDRKKEEIENEVRQLRGQIRELEAELASLEKRFSETAAEFEEKQKSSDLDVHRLELFYNYFAKLDEDMNAQKKEIIRRLSELSGRQEALIEAYKEKKLFEILKDRIVKEDSAEKDRADQKEQDFLHLAKRQRER
ncbi:MAG: flagellar export protein FliJ [Nitrospirae bacterium]|nr:flagellar export protein FliJ [Nitrospirota bacterium]